MPLELCTPATIDLVVILFINSMDILGTIWGAPLPLIKKKKIKFKGEQHTVLFNT